MTALIRFRIWECVIQKKKYANNKRISLELIDYRDGSPVAHATVNMPEIDIKEDEVLIKNYSENAGIKEALMDAGVIDSEILDDPRLDHLVLDVSLHKILI